MCKNTFINKTKDKANSEGQEKKKKSRLIVMRRSYV